MLTIKLALRGLWRHKLRTIFTLVAVSFGYLLLLAFLSIHNGGHKKMIELGIRQGAAGHVVIQAAGYQEARSVELLVPDPEAVRRKVESVAPGSRVALRVFGGGLARSSSDAVGVLFAGVEPAQERVVSDLPDKLARGVYLGAPPAAVRRAESKPGQLWCASPLGPGTPPITPVVIGVQLAKTLNLDLCDKLVLDAQGLGDQESIQLRVVGLMRTGNVDLDGFFLQFPLAHAQRLLQLGRGVHQVAIFIGSAAGTEELVRRLASTPGGRGPLARLGNLEVLPWDRVLPELAEFIWLDASSGWVFIGIVFVIIGIGVLNTVLMSVMERTREFGIMRGLGMQPDGVLGLVMVEGLLIGALGVVCGGILSWPLLWYLQTTGIVLSQGESGMEMGGLTIDAIRGATSASQILYGALAVFAMAILSTIYPAIRAAKVRILRAVNHV